MSETRASFWRDLRNLYVLYMVSAVAAVPAGLIYAILAMKHLDRWWTTVPLLALGLASALLAWSHCHRNWFPVHSEPLRQTAFRIERATPSKHSV